MVVAASAARFFTDVFDGGLEDLAALAAKANHIGTNNIGQGGVGQVFKHAGHGGG